MATTLNSSSLADKVDEAIRKADGSSQHWADGIYPFVVIVDPSVREEVLNYLLENQIRYGDLSNIELTPSGIGLANRGRSSYIYILPTKEQVMELARDTSEAQLHGYGCLSYIKDLALDDLDGRLQ